MAQKPKLEEKVAFHCALFQLSQPDVKWNLKHTNECFGLKALCISVFFIVFISNETLISGLDCTGWTWWNLILQNVLTPYQIWKPANPSWISGLNYAAPYWITPLENKTEDFAKSIPWFCRFIFMFCFCLF